MYTSAVAIEYPTEKYHWNLGAIADTHIGNVGFDKKGLKETLKGIQERDINIVLLGDIIDGICCKDKRHSYESLDFDLVAPNELYRYVDETVEYAKELFYPIRENIIGVVRGNHEQTLVRDQNRDVSYELARHLDVPYLHMSGFLRLKFRRSGSRFRRGLDVFYHHGHGSVSTKAGKVRKNMQMAEGYIADIYLMGHVHEPYCEVDCQIGVTHGRTPSLMERHRAYYTASSWLDTVMEGRTLYGEERMFRPAPKVFKYLSIYPETGIMKARDL